MSDLATELAEFFTRLKALGMPESVATAICQSYMTTKLMLEASRPKREPWE